MVATWKKDVVEDLEKQIKSHRVVGIVAIEGVPSKPLQNMKRQLKGQASIVVARSSLIRRALEKSGVGGLAGLVDGPSGVVFSDLNPFQLEKMIYRCKTTAPARPGSIAPFDLVVPAGDTGIPAGPVIGDMQAAGVKAKIQGGRIVVTEDSVLVRKGAVVNDKVSAVLTRLGIEPMEIALKLKGAYDGAMVYPGEVLHIDEDETKARLSSAHMKAFNLAYNARIYNREVIVFLIQEAVYRARNLMVNGGIINRETVSIYLAKADAAAKSIRSVLPPEIQAELDGGK